MNKLRDLGEKFYRLTGSKKIRPALLLMCSDHGVARHGVSAFPQEVTLQMMQGYQKGTAAVNVLAVHAGADVFVVDVGTLGTWDGMETIRNKKVAGGTADFTCGPAMTEDQVRDAMAAGMQIAAELAGKGYNLFITAEMGIGNTTSSAALISAMLGLSASETVGRGSGIDDKRLKLKRDVVTRGLAVNKPEPGNGLDCLKKLGGFEHAALVGAMLSGKLHFVPTVLDGINATAAALCAYGMDHSLDEYLFASHLSVEPCHALALEYMHLEASLLVQMHLGEGTGACLLVPILRRAVALL